jgi:integrase
VSRPRKHDRHLPAYVRIKSGAYYYRTTKVCRVDEGEARLYELLADRMRTSNLQPMPAAVAAFKIAYLRTLAPSTRDEHARYLTIFSDEFAEFRVDQVRAVDIQRSVRNLYAGKDTAAQHYKARISTFFRWCVAEAGLREDNPCREVQVKKPRPRKTPWTDELFWQVRELFPPMQQCYHDLSFLLYQRTTDVRLLERSQVRDGVIHFAPTKTRCSSGKEVDVQLTPTIQAVLDRAAAIRREWKVVSPYVICMRSGSAYTANGIHSAYERADMKLHKDGKIGLNPKALRPYAATCAKRQGFSKDELQVGLAHTSVITTEGYIQQHETPVSEVVMMLPKRPQTP